ncbi:hypothetical protein EJ110_NYTH29328 [Nymphaea thermarum]|nr:hypothetical protein EJ110_NYTH29328 [Nymphaea thermarum]
MKKAWTRCGCTIMSDIRKDMIKSGSYINLLVSCPTGVIFWKANLAEKDPKNAEFIIDFLSSAIEEIEAKMSYKLLHIMEAIIESIVRTYTKAKELRKPGVTRFIFQFICLGSILKQKRGPMF